MSPDLSFNPVTFLFSHNSVSPVNIRVLLSFDLMTSVSPSNYDPFSYCSVLYINPASYVVIS